MNAPVRYSFPIAAVALFKTKHLEGFTSDELGLLLSQYPTVNEELFYLALSESTITIDGESIYTYDDVAYALTSAIYAKQIYEDYEPL